MSQNQKNIHSINSILIASLISVSAGCATVSNLFLPRVTLAYEGKPRPVEEVGVLFGDGVLKITKIDGVAESDHRRMEAIQAGGWGQIDLLPGEHSIEFCFRYEESAGTDSFGKSMTKSRYCRSGHVAKLAVEKGRVYQAFLREEGGSRWRVDFEDVTLKRKSDVVESREKLNQALAKSLPN